MIRALVLALALLPSQAGADEPKLPVLIAKDGAGNVIRIFDRPCPDTVAWLNLRAAHMTYRGAEYTACWVLIGEMVVVLDNNSEATVVPAGAFKKEEAF